MISFPFSKTKRYLSGIDWVIAALDKLNKSITGLGNHSLIVLELDGSIDSLQLQSQLVDFCSSSYVLQGKISRDFLNLAPFWKIKKALKTELAYTVEEIPDEYTNDEILNRFSHFSASKFNNCYLSFLLCKNNKKSFLGLKFDHKVLDARGAEAFLTYLNDVSQFGDQGFYFPQEPFLRNWKDKFLAGKSINRFLRSLNRGTIYNSLDITESKCGIYFHTVETFDEAQSKFIIESANDCAGYLMVLPYLLGVVLKEYDSLFFANSSDESQYLVPVNMDRRGRNVKKENVFFNQVSFFYFNLLKQELYDDKTMFDSLKKQWYAQIKTKIPEAFELANRLSRIAPLGLVAKIMQKQFRKTPSALSFSYIGEEGYSKETFANLKVENIYHMPIVPIYPGIGVFFTRYQEKLKLVVSANASVVEKNSLMLFAKAIKKRLLADYEL